VSGRKRILLKTVESLKRTEQKDLGDLVLTKQHISISGAMRNVKNISYYLSKENETTN